MTASPSQASPLPGIIAIVATGIIAIVATGIIAIGVAVATASPTAKEKGKDV
jgi:hypothetical protein